MKGAYAIVVAIVVVVGNSVAFAQPRAPGGVRLVRSTLSSSTSGGAELRRRTISPDMARALAPVVFGATKGIRAPAVERETVWLDPPDADAKKRLRRVVPKLLTFPTGGAGVGLKLRY